jgi:hypothetical protein
VRQEVPRPGKCTLTSICVLLVLMTNMIQGLETCWNLTELEYLESPQYASRHLTPIKETCLPLYVCHSEVCMHVLVRNGNLVPKVPKSIATRARQNAQKHPRHFPRTRNFETVFIARHYRKLVDELKPISWGTGGWWSGETAWLRRIRCVAW